MNLGVELALLEWRTPLWLLLAGVPWLLAALVRVRERPLRRYADAPLHPWALYRADRRAGLRFALNALAWLLLAAALAGPRVPAPVEVAGQGHRGDVSLMLVLDVSSTMYAEDVAPRRLDRGLLEVDLLLERLQGERVGLVTVAGQSLLLTPPTDDHAVLGHYLQRAPQLLSGIPGKALASGLRRARETLAEQGGGAVVLITDGDHRALAEPHWADLLGEARALGEAAMPLYVLGVGGTQAVPVPGREGGLLRERGETVLSRMDTQALQELAAAAGGRYSTAGALGGRWAELYEAGVARVPSTMTVNHWRELYPWLLAPGLVLLLLSWFRRPPAGVGAVVLVCLILPLSSEPAYADGLRQAHAAWEAGEYLRALNAYAPLRGYGARVGEGASAYRLEEYGHAADAFTQAWLEAPGDRERAEALFNLGNARFRQEDFAAAVEAYRGALAYPSPHRERIEHNLALAAGRDLAAGGPGLPGRRARQATEDVGRMDLEETPGFPDDEPPPDTRIEEGEREATGEAVALGEVDSRADGAGRRGGRVLAVDWEYDAALKKLDLLEDRDLRLLRALGDREATP